MSSILNAFKKLENDKRISKPDQLRIEEKILFEGSPARFSQTTVSLIAVVLFVCGSGATYYYLKYNAKDAVKSQTIYTSTELNTPPAETKTISPMLKTVTANPTRRPPLSQIISPVSETHTHPTNTTKKTALKFQPKMQKKTATIPVSSPAHKATASEVARPTLTVNGIAFQDGGRNNMAMVNGVAVSSGDMIEGVKVEDIQKNRVLFSQGGEKFDINLNKTNR